MAGKGVYLTAEDGVALSRCRFFRHRSASLKKKKGFVGKERVNPWRLRKGLTTSLSARLRMSFVFGACGGA